MNEEELKKLLEEMKSGVEERDARHKAEIAELKRSMEIKAGRERLFGGGGEHAMERASGVSPDERKSFERYLRTGEVERKGMTLANGAEGGYLASEEFVREVASIGSEQGAIRGLARVVKSRTADLHLPILSSLGAGAWTGESGSRAATTAPSVASVHPSPGAAYAVVPVSNHLLHDGDFDVGAVVLEAIGQQLGAMESAAFVSGDAIVKPGGFLINTQAETGDATRAFGQVEKLKAGSTSAITVEKLLDLRSKLAPRFRRSAAWVCHPSTENYLRQLRVSTDGPFAWLPGLTEKSPSTLLGDRIELDVNMPEIASGARVLAYASWRDFYVISDIGQMTLIRDNVTSRGNTIFYAERRVAGAVFNSCAGKILSMEA